MEFERIPIPLEGVSYRKILNWIRLEAGIARRARQPWGMPTHFQIEPSTECNLRCVYCPVGSESGPTGHMDSDLFREFVSQIEDHALLLVMWGWGEPFLCPSIYEMIAHAHSRGVRMVSSTNGHVFVDPEHAEGVARSGLDALIVSTSGTTQEAYRRFRGGRVDEAIEGCRQVVAAKRRLGLDTPHVQLSCIITDYSEHQVAELRELARELGVDGLSLKKMNTASVRPREKPDERLPEEERYRRFEYSEDGAAKLRVAENPCKHLWQSPTLRWNGEVNPCAYDFDGIHKMGHLGSESFEKIWRGPAFREMRNQFRDDWKSLPICSRCTYAYAGGNYDEVMADFWLFDQDRA